VRNRKKILKRGQQVSAQIGAECSRAVPFSYKKKITGISDDAAAVD
jgi:hypothetical protein